VAGDAPMVVGMVYHRSFERFRQSYKGPSELQALVGALLGKRL
jgi:hypothetical protein